MKQNVETVFLKNSTISNKNRVTKKPRCSQAEKHKPDAGRTFYTKSLNPGYLPCNLIQYHLNIAFLSFIDGVKCFLLVN
jgi:hypothetical protein